MKTKIEKAYEFYNMLEQGAFKKTWSNADRYGIEPLILEVFEDELKYVGLDMAVVNTYGVLEAYLYEGFHIGDTHVNHVFICKNNDIVLIGDDEYMIILKDKPLCISMFEEN